MKIHVIIALLVSQAIAHSSCPTITSHSICPTCPVNACLRLSTVTLPCDCTATPVPTTTISHPCRGHHGGGRPCGSVPDCASTSYAFVTEPGCSPTTTPPSPSSSLCPTVTSSVRPADCTPPPPPGASFCAEPACLLLKTVMWPCACVGRPVPTATVTGCECRTGCGTSTQVVYLPCATSVPSPGPTVTDGPGCHV